MADETRLELYTKYKEHKNYQKPVLPEGATFAVIRHYLNKYGCDGKQLSDIVDTSALSEDQINELDNIISFAMFNNHEVRLVATVYGTDITQLQVHVSNLYTVKSNQVVLDTMYDWYPIIDDFKTRSNVGNKEFDPDKWFGASVNSEIMVGLSSVYKYIDGQVYRRTGQDIQNEKDKKAKLAEISSLKSKLSETDWIVTKITQASFRDENESAELVEKYNIQLAERDSWREKINALEAEVATYPAKF